MKQLSLLSSIVASTLLSFSAAQAQTTFFFHDGSNITGTGVVFDGQEGSVQDTVGAFTLTAEGFLDGVSTGTDLNGAGDGFGINAVGADAFTTRFDNAIGIESMEFSFNIGGTFESIDLRYIEETSNEAVLIFDGGNTYQLNDSNDGAGETFTINEAFTAGQSITLQISPLAAGAENFALESFTVVPEVGTFALLSGILALGFIMIRRRR